VNRDVNRFQPCPQKFAAMCRYDYRKALEILTAYERVGSGQYRKALDRSKFRKEVIAFCEASANRAAMPQRTQAAVLSIGVEKCHSGELLRIGYKEEEGDKIVVA